MRVRGMGAIVVALLWTSACNFYMPNEIHLISDKPADPDDPKKPVDPDKPVTYATLNAAILGPKCKSCHNTDNAKGGFDCTTYKGTMAEVDINHADDSNLYYKVSAKLMPPGNPLTADQIKLFKTWIETGAKEQ